MFRLILNHRLFELDTDHVRSTKESRRLSGGVVGVLQVLCAVRERPREQCVSPLVRFARRVQPPRARLGISVARPPVSRVVQRDLEARLVPGQLRGLDRFLAEGR